MSDSGCVHVQGPPDADGTIRCINCGIVLFYGS